ncbi:hypothetical protein [Leifsonia xyli]|uniref:hypothetical protein n=1 Tax=Leifsonia xyli TaxID=1575 RepID=UPI003D6716B8
MLAAAPAKENPFAGMQDGKLREYVHASNLRVPFAGLSYRARDELDEFLPGWRAAVTTDDYIAAIQSDKGVDRDVVRDIWEYHHQETIEPPLPSSDELLTLLPSLLDFLEADA